jgi:predicted amidophosphoribosyltransferase
MVPGSRGPGAGSTITAAGGPAGSRNRRGDRRATRDRVLTRLRAPDTRRAATQERFDYDERWQLLDGLHEVDRLRVEGRRILPFDDLFRSGATMNAVTSALCDQGHARDVYALALTRTRSRQ